MDQQQIALVRSSFDLVKPIAEVASGIFYDELFRLDPSLRPLFPDDLTDQRRKLMVMLGRAVNGLDNWPATSIVVRKLGERHAGYRVRPEHFETVGAALLSTLQKGLGAGFTDEVRAAWTACYVLVAGEMKVGLGAAAAA